MDPGAVLAAARARGLEIGAQLETHGYFQAWIVGEALVMRIPRVRALPHPRGPLRLRRGEGPLALAGGTLVDIDAQAVFTSALARQRDVISPYLPRFIDLLELAGGTVSLFERAPGHALAAPDPARAPGDASEMPRLAMIASALAGLHATFGCHGDLCAAHVFVDGDQVTFTDPLPTDGRLIGSAGYALPLLATTSDPHDETALVRDVAALAALFAVRSGADLALERVLESLVAAMRAGAYLLAGELRNLRETTRAAAPRIADPTLRDWVVDVFDLALGALAGRAPATGTARRALEALAGAPPAEQVARYRAALAPLAARAYGSPTLLDFFAAHRRRDDTQQPQYAVMDLLGASHGDPGALDRLLAVVAEVRALFETTFGAPPEGALARVEHPRGMWPETHDLHTLLVDAAALLDPSSKLAETGARLARIAELAPRVRDGYAPATRRYINFVCSPL